jgi:hypothetical protein
MQALHELDQSIEQLWTVLRRVPEHRYDAYILADHGQSTCTPFSELTHGRRLERWIFDGFLNPERAGEPEAARVGLWQGLRERQAETKGIIQRFMNYLDEDYLRCPDPEAHEQDGVRAISAGPNAFLYVKDAKEPLRLPWRSASPPLPRGCRAVQASGSSLRVRQTATARCAGGGDSAAS